MRSNAFTLLLYLGIVACFGDDRTVQLRTWATAQGLVALVCWLTVCIAHYLRTRYRIVRAAP